MPTLAISIDVPPTGELATSGQGASLTAAQTDEEMNARRKFLDIVSPYFQSLTDKPPRRTGNVFRVELLGRGVWSQLNHYLLFVNFDGEGEEIIPDIQQELLAKLPQGSKVSVVGAFEFLQAWSRSSD